MATHQRIKTLYLDTNIYNRPFDDQSQVRVRLYRENVELTLEQIKPLIDAATIFLELMKKHLQVNEPLQPTSNTCAKE